MDFQFWKYIYLHNWIVQTTTPVSMSSSKNLNLKFSLQVVADGVDPKLQVFFFW